METAIGVFTSRDHAEKAVKELLERGMPEAVSYTHLNKKEGDTIMITVAGMFLLFISITSFLLFAVANFSFSR